MKKEFEWQYSWEKILFKKKENIISFIFSKFWIIFSFIVFTIILFWVLYYLNYVFLAFFVIIFTIIFIIWYYYFLYKDSFLVFTSRRVIKQIRNWLFFKHRKELKILDIKSSMSNKKWFLQTILRIGNIKIEWTDDNWIIYFSGISDYEDLSNYIWRVIDYIKLNWHTDNISRYRTKKERKNKFKK